VAADILPWIAFGAFVIAMLALDLGVFHRKAHVIETREALLWTAFWIILALIFNVIVFYWRGPETALEFLTGYLIEKSLSVDNIFVFLLIFTYFKVPRLYEHKVLFWGILGALVMRFIFIAAGVALIKQFHFVIYVFGGLLILASIKMVLHKGAQIHPERNPVLRLFRRLVPVTEDYVDGKFIVRKSGVLYATPLLVVLMVIETTDLVFAVDSIPAILAITLDPFIVYSSNVFAILGLRALYFAIVGVIRMFRYLHYGLSAILFFVGVKMLVSDFYTIPVIVALGVVATMLLVSLLASLLRMRGAEPLPALADIPEKPEPEAARRRMTEGSDDESKDDPGDEAEDG
jgi:tellurite resistance protein TerC